MNKFTPIELEAIEKFRQFCESNNLDDHFSELDWYALSIGFFVALGFTSPELLETMAVYVRYDCNYWC